jgi:hypothetical protein
MKNKSKFQFKDNRSFKEKLINFIKGLLFWKGRKKGYIYTRDISFKDILNVFFPIGFYDKYIYLGSVPWSKNTRTFKAMEPLVIFMDYKAKPWWCPRWFLRFLHLFGSDNSIVRVRNRTLHNLKMRLTKGITLVDYKTKWTDYDLRISVSGNDQIQDLADSIETKFYDFGSREDLFNQIFELDRKTKFTKGHRPSDLRKELDRLEDINNVE